MRATTEAPTAKRAPPEGLQVPAALLLKLSGRGAAGNQGLPHRPCRDRRDSPPRSCDVKKLGVDLAIVIGAQHLPRREGLGERMDRSTADYMECSLRVNGNAMALQDGPSARAFTPAVQSAITMQESPSRTSGGAR